MNGNKEVKQWSVTKVDSGSNNYNIGNGFQEWRRGNVVKDDTIVKDDSIYDATKLWKSLTYPYEFLKPGKVIFNPPATICYFEDGTKEVSKCGDWEIFDEETGVAMCILKKIFKNRSEFVRIVNGGYHQPKRDDWIPF